MKQYQCIQDYHTRVVNRLGVIVPSPFPLVSKGDTLVEDPDEGTFRSRYDNTFVPESIFLENPDCFVLIPEPPSEKELELQLFLKYIMDNYTDSYSHLEICETGDELDPTIERVVKEYLNIK